MQMSLKDQWTLSNINYIQIQNIALKQNLCSVLMIKAEYMQCLLETYTVGCIRGNYFVVNQLLFLLLLLLLFIENLSALKNSDFHCWKKNTGPTDG